MKLLIKIPTYNRSYNNWFHLYVDNITNPDTRILLSVDHNDPIYVPDYVENHPIVTVVRGTSRNKIEAINRDINEYEHEWDVILVGSDDMYPLVKGFDQIILDDMVKHWPDMDGCLWYDTEDQDRASHIPSPRGGQAFFQKAICMMPVMGKPYYDRWGYIYHPSYKSFSCDNEQTDQARKLGKIVYIPHRIIQHMQPAWFPGSKVETSTYTKENPNFWPDHQHYLWRKARSFPQHLKGPHQKS